MVPHDHVIFTDLDGREGVLVDLNTKQYYLLNETACFIWRSLAEGRPVAAVAGAITEVYDVSLEHAQSSVETAVGRFIAHALLRQERAGA